MNRNSSQVKCLLTICCLIAGSFLTHPVTAQGAKTSPQPILPDDGSIEFYAEIFDAPGRSVPSRTIEYFQSGTMILSGTRYASGQDRKLRRSVKGIDSDWLLGDSLSAIAYEVESGESTPHKLETNDCWMSVSQHVNLWIWLSGKKKMVQIHANCESGNFTYAINQSQISASVRQIERLEGITRRLFEISIEDQ